LSRTEILSVLLVAAGVVTATPSLADTGLIPAAVSSGRASEPIRDDGFALDFDPGRPVCVALPRGRLAVGCDAALASAMVAANSGAAPSGITGVFAAFVQSEPSPWGLTIARGPAEGERDDVGVEQLEHELSGMFGTEGSYGTRKVETGRIHGIQFVRIEWLVGSQRTGARTMRYVAYALSGAHADYTVLAAGDPSQANEIDTAMARLLDTLRLTPPPVATTPRSTTARDIGVSVGLLFLLGLFVRSVVLRRTPPA
jgi:hypothetical protein